MATKYWEPKASAVAQVTTVTVGGTLAGETFTISVNGVTIASHTDTDTVIASTVADLVSDWNASTHPYATGITAADASPDITLTADTAEVPFTITLNSPGGSATFSQAATTAPTGPHTLDEAENWNGEALPANSDVLVFRDGSGNICWGLDGLSTTGHELHLEQSFTGKVGLQWNAYATSADGDTTDTSAPEYRAIYVALHQVRLEVGQHLGPGSPSGSTRLLIDDDSGDATTVVIHDTAASAAETGKPPVRLKFNHANADIDVRDGSVGIAADAPGEITTIGDLNVQGGAAYVGGGVTLTNMTLSGGTLTAELGASTVTQCLVHDGTATLHGDQVITTLKLTGGRVNCNVTGTIGTAELEGGTLDLSQSAEARTVTTCNLHRGATLVGDDDVVTITTLNEPDGPYRIAVS